MQDAPYKLNILIGHAYTADGSAPRLTHLVRDDDERTITVCIPGSLTVEQVDQVVPVLVRTFAAGQDAARRAALPARPIPLLDSTPERPFALTEEQTSPLE